MNSLMIAWNMIKRTVGTKKGILFFIVLPCIIVSLTVALMGQSNNSEVRIPYSNEDVGTAGQYIIDVLSRNADYVLELKSSKEEVRDMIMGRQRSVGLSIPAEFTEQLLSGNEPQIAMYQLTGNEASYIVKLSLDRIVGGMAQTAGIISNFNPDNATSVEVFAKSIEEMGNQRIQSERTDYNLYAKPGLSNVTGFTIMFMMGLVSSIVKIIIDDRRNRTIARIYSAPVRSYEIALGHILGSLFVGIIQIIIVLIFSRYVLKYDYDIPFLTHFLILGLFMLVSMGIASTVAGMVRNPTNAGMLNAMIITPTCMLGGCFWPLSIMPEYLQKVANFIPQKWAIEAVDRVASGDQLVDIWLPLSILGLMAIILLAIGSVILRPSDTKVSA
ncbi:ABC transporter permease [Paenibacillus crassostreae]|uniref:ABC transporter n=1 Tax=Paenibacillus crassostreae TaxID=1763538 RepID=A0A167E2S3_9BACL|nr:ABC transporter permease [Paenibacillus crassostreae]AOZ93278.1 ABC transporter [Paenibacillus crassostreae]OAB75077.1 ABC transporter [Paenibacillus crassostreae]